ncbi:MAG: cyclase [Candidatus Acidiferrum sp.]
MVTVIVRHKVEDYEKWRRVFDSAAPIRNAGGETNPAVFRNASDGNDVIVLAEWADENTARRFFNSLQAGKAKLGWWMQEGGVVSQPEVSALKELELAK